MGDNVNYELIGALLSVVAGVVAGIILYGLEFGFFSIVTLSGLLLAIAMILTTLQIIQPTKQPD